MSDEIIQYLMVRTSVICGSESYSGTKIPWAVMPVRVRVSSSVLRHIHNYRLYVKTQQGSPWEDNHMIEEVVVYYF